MGERFWKRFQIFTFRPLMQAPKAPCISLPSEMEVARALCHLAVVHSFVLPPTGSDPQSISKWVSVLPEASCTETEDLQQNADDWWEKEALGNQTTYFLSDLSLNFYLVGFRKWGVCLTMENLIQLL